MTNKPNNYDLSIVIASIRPHYWNTVYNSLLGSCGKYKFELIFVGPFEPPENFVNNDTIKYIKDFGSVSRAAQIGANIATGKLFFSTVDDCFFIKNAVQETIDYYYGNCNKFDVVGMRFREIKAGRLVFERPQIDNYPEYLSNLVNGCLTTNEPPFMNQPYPPAYWFFKGVPIAVQPFLDLNTFKEIGGWDCNYEYLCAPAADLGIRLQNMGGRVLQSLVEISLAEFWPEHSLDHKPIHDSTRSDEILFEQLLPKLKSKTIIDFNNWEQSSEIWKKRFPNGKTLEYETMLTAIGGNYEKPQL